METNFIKNTDDATIICRLDNDKNKTHVFRPKKIDKKNGFLLTNGYTEITAAELVILREHSKTFIHYEAHGKLTVVENLPHEAMTDEQLVMTLKTENAAMKKQLKEAKLLKPDNEALQDALKSIESGAKENTALSEANDVLAEEATELKEKITELSALLDAAEAKLKDEAKAEAKPKAKAEAKPASKEAAVK